ncbi:hypothetical protein MKL09_05205, partial [Methylobacterium sp. J-048]|uniref:hypothetical protein n=1 Tax=Methylobacterium sp. J-048 TaxID=2836635 RepID=UPI001FBA1C48
VAPATPSNPNPPDPPHEATTAGYGRHRSDVHLARCRPFPRRAGGENAGHRATRGIIKALSPEKGSVEGVVRRIGQVGIIVARGHQEAGMRTDEVRAWHIGFEAGMRLELGDYMRRF